MKNKKVPMRKCVGCQEMKNKKEMIRIVRTEECLLQAIKNKGLERSFKQAIPTGVYEVLEKEMNEIESE